jgi:hypothetical protein
MGGRKMIWESEDKDVRINEVKIDLLSLHLMSEEYIFNLLMSREEVISLTSALVEWCGMPVFIGDEGCEITEGCPNEHDDDVSLGKE